MFSIANSQYPLVVFEKNSKKLLHPLTKQRYIIRPEELVRLRWLEGVLHVLQWNKSRISTEQQLVSAYKSSSIRADIVLFSKEFTPQVLIECKAPHISLSDSTALQAGLYNQTIQSPYCVLTNGSEDLWFSTSGEKWEPLTTIPFPVFMQSDYHFEPDYWITRGFLGSQIDRQAVKPFMAWLYEWFLKQPKVPVVYHPFTGHPILTNWASFYAVFSEANSSYHISVQATANGKSYINVIGYESKQVKSLLSIDLDAVLAGFQNCAEVFGIAGRKQVPLPHKTLEALQQGVVSSSVTDLFSTILFP